MGGADEVLAAEADEVVLVVVGEAEHFVRHDVADVDDQVPGLLHQHRVERDRDRPVGGALADVLDEVGGNFADGRRRRRANRGRGSARWGSSRTSGGFLPACGARAGRGSG